MERIKFSVSPSSMNLYNSSQLLFYFSYISKSQPDTDVPTAYGVAGQCLHKLAEDISKLSKQEVEAVDIPKMFEEYWISFNVDAQTTVNRKPLKKAEYLKAAYKVKELALKDENIPVHSELSLIVEELGHKDDVFDIKVKGIIDRVCKDKDGKLKIVDFKTSSGVDEGEGFKKQVAFYCFTYYKKYGEMPLVAEIEYIKIGKQKRFEFTSEEVLEVEGRIKSFIAEIVSKGTDKSKYSLGDISGIFNCHMKKCLSEKSKREQVVAKTKEVDTTQKLFIEGGIKKNRIFFNYTLPEKIKKAFGAKFKYQVQGYQFSPLYQKRIWDGYKRFYKRHSLPLPFLSEIVKLIDDFNVHYSTNYALRLTEFRDANITTYKSKNVYQKAPVELRYYQKEAVEVALEKKFGILYLGTSAGKTFIAAELIKKTNQRTLYLINRLELVDQTALEYEKYLGVKVGRMYEGQLSVQEDIIVAAVQTVLAILKRDNEETKKLKQYLSAVNMVQYDECHGVSDSKTYDTINNLLLNVSYVIGFSGTPQRNDGSTLEMNAMCGFVIYSKPSKELEKEGFVCPVKISFIENHLRCTGEYADEYRENIVRGKVRNETIVTLVKELRHKKILILTKLVEHAKVLGELIPGSYVITGSTDREERKDNFADFKVTDGTVLIGSVKIFSTGINLPNLDIIINAACLKGENDVIQSIGRVMRNSDGKKLGYYIDFFDSSGYFLDAAESRIDAIKKYGYDYCRVNTVTVIETIKNE